MGRDAPRLGFAPNQLAQGERTAPTQQFIAPFVVQAPPLIEYEEHLEAGVAKQHVRWLLPGGVKLFGAVRHIQALQQALADPTLTLPFAGIGQERVGLFGRYGEQAQII
jgi:hypothetical protein